MRTDWKLLAGVAIAGILVVACNQPPVGGAPDAAAPARYADLLHEAAPGLTAPAARPIAPAVEPGDELVIVERADGTRVPYGPDRIAALRAKVEGHERGVPLPLERTDVSAEIRLNLGTVVVKQAFTNPFASKIEAVYVFPLPQDAAVSDFVMQIGERRIRGIVREREEARRIYEAARAQGHRASLLSQERPNVFTQSVANLEPGQRIDVETTYFETLPWRDGAFELVVPTVVGPRFNPPGSTTGIGAAPFDAAGTSGQPVEVTYLPPERSVGHRIGIQVALDAGMPLGVIECASHPVTVVRDGATAAKIALRDGDSVPNRDFVLRYAMADTDLCGAVAVQRATDGEPGWFSMLLQPPLEPTDAPAPPRELVFVVDCSGSMDGEPLAACQRVVRRCLDRLRPADAFDIIRFSNTAAGMDSGPLAADPANVAVGLAHVDGLRALGGTMMMSGVLAALRPAADPGRQRVVVFLTDGFLGNEAEVLGAVHRQLGAARVFSIGVGSSTNRYLLERMAELGRGAAAYVDPGDGGERVVGELFRRLDRPALADLALDWGGAAVTDVEPSVLPDLHFGRPLVVHGRVRGALPRSVRLQGRIGGTPTAVDLPIGAANEHGALDRLWARARIRRLETEATWVDDPDERIDQVRALALQYGLASRCTSFLAVDATTVTAGGFGTTVQVPVPVPQGVRYETAVQGSK
ncbi:MAG: VIT domain-containing protein [Planctomycetota bacterium]